MNVLGSTRAWCIAYGFIMGATAAVLVLGATSLPASLKEAVTPGLPPSLDLERKLTPAELELIAELKKCGDPVIHPTPATPYSRAMCGRVMGTKFETLGDLYSAGIYP